MKINVIHIYFGMYIIMAVLRIAFRQPVFPYWKVMPSWVLITMIVMDIFNIIGIFGAAFKKEIFAPLFWKIFLPFSALYILALTVLPNLDNFGIFLWSFSLYMLAPYTIYSYGFTYNWVFFKNRNNVPEKPKYVKDYDEMKEREEK